MSSSSRAVAGSVAQQQVQDNRFIFLPRTTRTVLQEAGIGAD